MHSSAQVPTWWWAESSRGLIGAKGLFIGFIDIVMPLGNSSVNSFVVCTTFRFSPSFLNNILVGLFFLQDISIGNHRLSALLPAASPLKVEILDSILISVILVIS